MFFCRDNKILIDLLKTISPLGVSRMLSDSGKTLLGAFIDDRKKIVQTFIKFEYKIQTMDPTLNNYIDPTRTISFKNFAISCGNTRTTEANLAHLHCFF